MSTLTLFRDSAPDTVVSQTGDGDEIARQLEAIGIRFERWPTRDLPENATQEQILEAYSAEVAQLKSERGFKTVDVVSLHPEHPDREQFRQKFLNEHRHSEDEVRFFVDGQGLFYLHIGDTIYAVLCQRNDLISVPHGTKHWFDMGPHPAFTCIRLFDNQEGWVAQFTGEELSAATPRFESLAQANS